MKKKILGTALLVAVLFGSSLFNNLETAEAKLYAGDGWFWQAETIPCTVSTSLTIGGGPIPLAYQTGESYEGVKRVCRDGWSVCLSGSCN